MDMRKMRVARLSALWSRSDVSPSTVSYGHHVPKRECGGVIALCGGVGEPPAEHGTKTARD